MRLMSFVAPALASHARGPRTGIVAGEDVVDLTDPYVGLPGDMAQLLGMGEAGRLRAAAAPDTAARRWPLAQIEPLAPVPLPPKLLAIGMNYRAHVAELGREPPPHQYWFNKQRTCVVGPDHPIAIPSVSEQVDYEGELAIVIGRRASHVPAEHWLEVVAGFTVINDVSVRDWQSHSPTFTMGKSFDTHAPMGPALVSPDEVDDAGSLNLTTWVNDEVRQSSSTADLIFGCAEMIEYLSTVFPLEPGDVLATGTPAGVGLSYDPPRWLQPGDRVRIEIEGLGVLENPVEAAKPPEPWPPGG